MSTANKLPERDYNSISSSARALLLLKGYTNIPFARKVAELISLPEHYEPDFTIADFTFWARVMHFDVRYRAIDQLLHGLKVKNILELSSGFSFRGLQTVQEEHIHYIDTDLPDLMNTKRQLISELQDDKITSKGHLELLPLNAVDETQFREVVAHFPAGKVAIVNEGLLMYLGMEEKTQVCRIIHNILNERGGYWITADIYIKNRQELPGMKVDDKLQRFFEQHNIVDNMFDSFEAAEAFFRLQGFVVDKEAEPEYSSSVALKYLLESAAPGQLETISKGGEMQATWRLKLA